MISESIIHLGIETITKNEAAAELGTNWKTIRQICESKNYTLLESIGYERHRGQLFIKEDFEQWLKDCCIAEELAAIDEEKVNQKKGLDKSQAQAFIRRQPIRKERKDDK